MFKYSTHFFYCVIALSCSNFGFILLNFNESLFGLKNENHLFLISNFQIFIKLKINYLFIGSYLIKNLLNLILNINFS